MYLLEGKTLPLDQQFFHNNIRYPSNWLRLSTQEQRDAIGITWEDDPVFPNPYFYTFTVNDDGSINSIPNDIDALKADMVYRTKQSAGALLAQTDWMVIRQQETGRPVSDAVVASRTAIRIRSDEIEHDINSCSSVEELEKVDMRIMS